MYNDCRLIECSDLTIKNGNCDPFAIVTMCYSNSRQESKRTKVKKKTVSPHFDEALVFEVSFVYRFLLWCVAICYVTVTS
jgi:C2 domain.